jgi:phosphate ABC transporter permease protein PstC
MEAADVTPTRRAVLPRGSGPRFADPVLQGVLAVAAAGVLILIGFFFVKLVIESTPAFDRTGVLDFVFGDNWVPSKGQFGALPLLFGTLVTAVIALLIGVPVAIASALYITELCPRRIRQPLTILVELLAAVPSVVYGLWGIVVLAPFMLGPERSIDDALGFLPFFGGPASIPNYFVTGLVLAIMILPIVSAISREVMATVPADHKEAALALGATRWETIRIAVLPYSRAGISGAAMLGLGRAIGETIAVTILIGNAAVIGHNAFSQGYTLAAVQANEFGEAASDPVHRASLIAAGLLLFVLTLAINLVARVYVSRAESAGQRRLPVGMAG